MLLDLLDLIDRSFDLLYSLSLMRVKVRPYLYPLVTPSDVL